MSSKRQPAQQPATTQDLQPSTNTLLQTPTPPTAAHSVLLLTELLTTIFTHLPPSTLVLSASLARKTWHHVLSQPSPELQLALYLRPHPLPLNTAICSPSRHHGSAFNDIFTAIMPGYFDGSVTRIGINSNGGTIPIPSFRCLPWIAHPSAWRRKRHGTGNNTASPPPPLWRYMQICQPPILELGVFRDVRTTGRSRTSRACIQVPGGVTIGLVHDLLEYFVGFSRGDPSLASDVAVLLPMEWLREVEVDIEWTRKRFELWDTGKWLHFSVAVVVEKRDLVDSSFTMEEPADK